MNGKTISVPVEWALHGKTAETGSDGYRILSCSDGDLSSRNFEDVHARFTPGTPHTLPQVSLSYQLRAEHPDGTYLTLAIHEAAAGGRQDHVGREIMFTRYYCVPYPRLRNHAVSYTTLYAAFRAAGLPECCGSPLTVELPVTPPGVPTGDELARRTAALLLTAPVCVLGAEHTAMEERLAFIDGVMTLLPYGMRARMSATTWTRASQRAHRFRLFFSDAPRGGDAKDHQVVWGHPEKSVSPTDRNSRDYYRWLDDAVHRPVRALAGVADEWGFNPKQVVQMLERIGIESGDVPLDQADGGDNLHARTFAAEGNAKFGEASLLRCVENLKTGNLPGLKNSISDIAHYLEHQAADAESRSRCRAIIAGSHLLRPGLLPGKTDSRFYDALLPLAFGTPLTYRGYCQLEDCLGTGRPPAQLPNRTLLQSIEKCGLTDPVVTAIVRWYLSGKELDKWLRQANVTTLAGLVAKSWERPHHGQVVCDMLVRCLDLQRTHRNYDPRPAQAALRHHGYLAYALHLRHPDNPEYQYQVLTAFLRACFPGGMTRDAVSDALKHPMLPATPALLAAAVILLRDPDDVGFAERQYVDSVLEYTNFSPATRGMLRQRAVSRDTVPRDAVQSARYAGVAPPLSLPPAPVQAMGHEDTVAMPPPRYEEPPPGPDGKHVGKTWKGRLGGFSISGGEIE